MASKATLAWIAGICTVLLIALVVIAGMQGQSSNVEAQLNSPQAGTIER